MANNYQARLKAIEAALKAKQLGKVSQLETQHIEALRAMSDEEIASHFQEMLNQPPSPETRLFVTECEGLTDHQVINKYLHFIREGTIQG